MRVGGVSNEMSDQGVHLGWRIDPNTTQARTARCLGTMGLGSLGKEPTPDTDLPRKPGLETGRACEIRAKRIRSVPGIGQRECPCIMIVIS